MTEEPYAGSIAEHFGKAKDPRGDRTKQNKLLDIILIATCGVICGADNWVTHLGGYLRRTKRDTNPLLYYQPG